MKARMPVSLRVVRTAGGAGMKRGMMRTRPAASTALDGHPAPCVHGASGRPHRRRATQSRCRAPSARRSRPQAPSDQTADRRWGRSGWFALGRRAAAAMAGRMHGARLHHRPHAGGPRAHRVEGPAERGRRRIRDDGVHADFLQCRLAAGARPVAIVDVRLVRHSSACVRAAGQLQWASSTRAHCTGSHGASAGHAAARPPAPSLLPGAHLAPGAARPRRRLPSSGA